MIKAHSIKAQRRGFVWGAHSQGLGAACVRLSQRIPADLPAGRAAQGRASAVPAPPQRSPCPTVKRPFPAASIGRQPASAGRHGHFTSSKRNWEVFVVGGYKALNCVEKQSFQLLKLASLEPVASSSRLDAKQRCSL